MNEIDYLAVGAITYDLIPTGRKVGGTVSFASKTAKALGYNAAVLTSAAPDFPFDEALAKIPVRNVPADATATFSNIYAPLGRKQIVHAVCQPIRTTDVPAAWQNAAILHLAPLVDEVDAQIVQLFPNSLIGITPQGYLRNWGDDGVVYPAEWERAEEILSIVDAAILSEEDIPNIETAHQFAEWVSLLALTQGGQGCTIFWNGERRSFPAIDSQANELTGAGDIFAAAFLAQLRRSGGDAWGAAEFANKIAGQSISAETVDDKVVRIERFLAGEQVA